MHRHDLNIVLCDGLGSVLVSHNGVPSNNDDLCDVCTALAPNSLPTIVTHKSNQLDFLANQYHDAVPTNSSNCDRLFGDCYNSSPSGTNLVFFQMSFLSLSAPDYGKSSARHNLPLVLFVDSVHFLEKLLIL